MVQVPARPPKPPLSVQQRIDKRLRRLRAGGAAPTDSSAEQADLLHRANFGSSFNAAHSRA